MSDPPIGREESRSIDLPPRQSAEFELVPTLLSIAKSTRALVTVALADIDLFVGQDQLLDALKVGRPVSISTISDILNVRPSTVSKMVDRLVVQGLVRRSPNHDDARSTMLELTDVGKVKRKEVRAAWRKIEAGLMRTDPIFSDEDLWVKLAAVDAALAKRLARLR